MISFAEFMPYLKNLAIFSVIVGTICILVTYETAASIQGVILSLIGIDPPDLSDREHKIKINLRIFGHIMILLGLLGLAFLCYSTCCTCENLEPTVSELSPDKSSPQEGGETVTWTVEASDPEKDHISYKFFLNDRAVTEWQSMSHWDWNIEDSIKGDNRIEVRIRDGKHADENSYDDNETAIFIIRSPDENEMPKLSDLSSNKSSPQEVGETITWTAEATDAEDDPISYGFFLNGQPVTEWQPQSYWIWETDDSNERDNKIEVRIRDGKHADESGFDDSGSVSFEIGSRPNQKPTIKYFLPDKPSPQEAGETITWTAEASDSEDNPISYRFFLNGQPVTEWQPQSYWIWETNDSNERDNKIEVRIRDGEHADESGFDDSGSVSFEIGGRPNQEPHADESGFDDSRPDSFAIKSTPSVILYRFSRDEQWLTAPNYPTTSEQVELKLEPIPDGNINKYQWRTNLELNYIGKGNPIYYTFKVAGDHQIIVDVIYKNGSKISFNRSLKVAPQY